MLESINVLGISQDIKFARKTTITQDYDSDTSVATYELVVINSNVHDQSDEDREYDNPQYKSKKIMRLTNNNGDEYKSDDYFAVNGVIYSMLSVKNRLTFNSCIAEAVDINNANVTSLLS